MSRGPVTATVTPTGRTITDMGPFWNRRDKAVVYHIYDVRYSQGVDFYKTIAALDDADAAHKVRQELVRRNAAIAKDEALRAQAFEVRL
jgi:hypothetical protein